jgi:hypothetical protein
MTDYVMPAERISAATSLHAKRSAAVQYLRQRGKYIVDPGCAFVPTGPASTDVRATIVHAMRDAIVQECDRLSEEQKEFRLNASSSPG